MDAALRREIEGLRKLSTAALKNRYREWFGEESPSYNREHLFRRIAWRMQARVSGGLAPEARERARLLADPCDLRLRAPQRFWEELEQEPEPASRDSRLPAPGAVLRRTYRGKEIVVMVTADGFEYEGRRYATLSTIASEATGTRWNGFAFFGLEREAARD